jgi:shikimate kinase
LNIALFGFMGVGKSEVAKILAEKLRMSYVDIDEKIEKTARKTITSIFEEEGEEAFRREGSGSQERTSHRMWWGNRIKR